MRLPANALEHMDANEAAHITRALTAVETTIRETLFEPMKSELFIPVDTSDSPGADYTSYVMLTGVGIAKLVTSRGQDLPRVTAFRKEFQRKYWPIGCSYDFTIDELRAAEFANRNGIGPVFNLDTTLAKTAKQTIARGLDKVGALGSATSSTISGLSVGIGGDVGMLGILNQPNASAFTPATGGSGSSAWAQKTPDEILADMNGQVTAMIVSTREAFSPTRFLLPTTQYRKALTTRMGDGSDRSILELFKSQNPGVLVEPWLLCAGAGTAGADRGVAFQSDEMVLGFKISVSFEQLPAEFRNRLFKIDCMAKTAGVVCRYPIAVSYMDGI